MASRVEREISVWGTEIYISAGSEKLDSTEIERVISGVEAFFFDVDDELSTFKPNSSVSRIRQNKLHIDDAPDIVKEVWRGCLKARELSFGAFDPWSVEGGFDPSGYVKGWAADKCIEILKKHGASSIQINAAGDISVAGGTYVDGVHKPWSIGIRHPEDAIQIVKVFEIQDGSIATSGTYKKD